MIGLRIVVTAATRAPRHARRVPFPPCDDSPLMRNLTHPPITSITSITPITPIARLAVIAACATLVRPGGWVFFSTINRNPLSFLSAIVGVEYVLRILPRGTHQYKRFIKPAELLLMAQAAGLQLRDKRGLGYNPITQRFRLHKFDGIAYLLAMQKT